MGTSTEKRTSENLLIALFVSVWILGCGVSAPHSNGPAPPAGGTGFTTATDTQLWLRQFGTGTPELTSGGNAPTAGILDSGDILTGIAADPSGNIVVAGYTFGAFPGVTNPHGSAQDFVAKFDPAGKQLWLQQFGIGTGDYLNAVATDTAGNIFAAGFTTHASSGTANQGSIIDAVALKIDANGSLLWLRQFSSRDGIDIRAIAYDGRGGLLVTGVEKQQTAPLTDIQTQLTSQQAFVAKLNGNTGNTVWQQTFGESGITILNAIAADAAGNAYVAGEATTSSTAPVDPNSLQLLALKLSAVDGSAIWRQNTIGDSNVADETFLRGIALDSQGNAIVSGIAFGSDSSSFIAKLNGGNGRQIWFTPFGGTTLTFADNVAVDADGNVLVAGSTYAALLPQFQPFTDDVFLAKFNTDGQNMWLQQFGTGDELSVPTIVIGPLPSENQVQVAVDRSGNALVGGITFGQFQGFNNPTHAMEAFAAKFGP